MSFLLALAALAALPSGFETLVQAGKDAPFCTADGEICVSATDEGAFAVTSKGQPLGTWSEDQDDDSFEPLPMLLRLKGGALLVSIGVQQHQMYSGGNADVEAQRLMLLRPGADPRAVLEVPYRSDISIRACFSEKDMKQRAGACHDDYALTGDLSVGPRAGDLPDLLLNVRSTSFPRGVSRDADSLALPPLTKRDLVTSEDKACTYRRAFHFDAAAGEYRPDAPLPDCGQYTTP
ncbi:hypothetical protein [Novosphingobium terrae]|uniref:hypothetical protein n=1 Tax=Novosphingobium terrae TaxID=2726189 RepID=UPI00197F757A|nr:hypothetical protein [Novosphingobium terrae]